MLSLADLQRQFAGAVLAGDVPALALKGAVRPQDAFAVHRDTIIGAWVNALRLSYPTVDALVGEDFFDHAARQFALTQPPRHANLDRFGQAFADFLQSFAPASALPYLADVARLDWAVGQALRQPLAFRTFALDPHVSLHLPQSLAVLPLSYPAHAIRAALGDDAALAALDMSAADYRVIVWRKDATAAVQTVRKEAGAFLGALIEGAGAEAALQRAGAETAATFAVIQQDVFAASFCQISTPSEDAP